MPLSLKAMAIRKRRSEEEFKLQSELYHLQSSMRQLKPRQTTKLFNLMTDIYQRCGNYGSTVKRYPAVDFEDLREIYSPPTIIKAKRVLGVKSVRKDGTWFWTQPRRTPEEAMKLRQQDKVEAMDEARHSLAILQRQVCKDLGEVMKASSYFGRNSEILEEMAKRGYARGTVLHAKAELSIATVSLDGKYYWVWQDEDVRAWVEGILSYGPVPVAEVMESAFQNENWHMEVIKMAIHTLGTIRYTVVYGKVCYYNLSDPSASDYIPAKPPDTYEEKKQFVRKEFVTRPQRYYGYPTGSPRVITVDFTGVKSPGWEKKEKVLPSGVKIGVFE